jgi:hypothetical protein
MDNKSKPKYITIIDKINVSVKADVHIDTCELASWLRLHAYTQYY